MRKRPRLGQGQAGPWHWRAYQNLSAPRVKFSFPYCTGSLLRRNLCRDYGRVLLGHEYLLRETEVSSRFSFSLIHGEDSRIRKAHADNIRDRTANCSSKMAAIGAGLPKLRTALRSTQAARRFNDKSQLVGIIGSS